MAATLVSCSRAPARCSSRLPATILRRPRPFTLVIAARSASTSSSPRPPPPPYDVLFCGTDFFAATILQSLHRTPSVASSITVAVPAARDYHATRSGSGSTTKQRRSISSSSSSSSAASGAAPTHVIDYATSHSLPSLRISSDSDYPTPSPSSSSNPLLITASYGRMIPSSLLDKYASPSLTLNVHPSLLPDLRGAAPIQWAIARGYERTGVSVQQLGRNAFDRGDLLAQRGVDLPAQAGYAQLEEVLARESAELLIETLQRLPERHDARIGQDEERKTFAPKVRQEHGRVGWEEMCAEEGVNRQRGFGHQISLYTHLSRRGSSAPPTQILLRDVSLPDPAVLKRSSAKRLLSDDLLYPPGTAVFVAKHPHYESSRDQILVKTAGGEREGVGRLVEVKRIQSAGKAEHKGGLREWWKGYGSVKGEMPTLRFVSEAGTGAKSATTKSQAPPPPRQATTSTSTAAFVSSSSSRLLGQQQVRAYSTRPTGRRSYSTQRPPSPSFNTASMTPNTSSSPSSTPTTPPRPPRRRGTIYKLTGDGLSWSQLHPVQKVFRTGEKTGQFTVVVLGTALTAAVLWTLLSDMFAPNSPSVIFKDACGRVERCGEIYTHLLPPLRFHLRPTATFTSSPSPTNPIIGALGGGGGGGSTHRGSHLPPTHIIQEERTGMEVLHMRFYIEARDKERDWTWAEKGRQWVRDGVDVVRGKVREGWVELMRGQEGVEGKEGAVVTRAEAESRGQASAAAPSRISTFLSSLSFLPTSSTTSKSSPSNRREPGTFATGEAHVEMVRRAGSNDTWQYRRLSVDVPRSGTIGATRVWVVKREGEVRR